MRYDREYKSNKLRYIIMILGLILILGLLGWVIFITLGNRIKVSPQNFQIESAESDTADTSLDTQNLENALNEGDADKTEEELENILKGDNFYQMFTGDISNQ